MLYYIRDIANNIIGLVDSNNQLVAKYSYDAFGNVLTKEGAYATKNPFLHKGYYYEHSMELYYLESRYYDPYIRRFISPDNIDYLEPTSFSGLNLYAYCGNDITNFKYFNSLTIKSSVSNIKSTEFFSLNENSFGSTGLDKVNWGNGGFQIPIWISSLMSGTDFGASIAPALRTIYQYLRYPGVKDLNKLYGSDFVPGKLNTICSAIGYGLLGLNIGLSAWSNFTNDNLTTKQKWISFGADTAYTLGTFGIGYAVGTFVSMMIPGVGVFIAPFVSAGIAWIIDLTNKKWGWLDEIKQWLNDL